MDEVLFTWMMDNSDASLVPVVVSSGVAGALVLGGVIAVNEFGPALRRNLAVWMLGGVAKLDRDMGVDCPMCLDGMVAGDVVRKLSCGHVFHKACEISIDRWLRENNLSCPICRERARSVRVLLPWRLLRGGGGAAPNAAAAVELG
uniref:RING-type domain-containing protein n=1 Tax=Leersia perrieri TaxID=77586 RepID=A0A0D9W6G4_9ORYZ